jgi:hypothetical protein
MPSEQVIMSEQVITFLEQVTSLARVMIFEQVILERVMKILLKGKRSLSLQEMMNS